MGPQPPRIVALDTLTVWVNVGSLSLAFFFCFFFGIPSTLLVWLILNKNWVTCIKLRLKVQDNNISRKIWSYIHPRTEGVWVEFMALHKPVVTHKHTARATHPSNHCMLMREILEKYCMLACGYHRNTKRVQTHMHSVATTTQTQQPPSWLDYWLAYNASRWFMV